jgi:site-specific recombinase XerD
MKTKATFSELLQAFFTEWLMNQRNFSPNTIANYRDTFRLLLAFAHRRLKKSATVLCVEDLDAPFVVRFLDYLEMERKNTPQSRNVRLAALHSFFHYVALQEPSLSAVAQHVLAIPSKRFAKKPVNFLNRAETEALLSAPDQTTWSGRRDHAWLLVAVQTGLRISELIQLRCQDVVLAGGAHVRCTGKGRKTRCVPLRKDTVAALRAWSKERRGEPSEVLFPNARGHAMSRDGVEYLLAKHLVTARKSCPSLKAKRVSAHVLRHSLAMNLLRSGVDRSVIALWLGHEQMDTTQVYLHADLELKEQALAKTEPFVGQSRRFQPPEQLLSFLQSL